MTAHQIKLLTLLFALVNVWLLFHVPAVSEALLKFISVGQIPGTEKMLSPDASLYFAIGSFIVSVVLIFWREFRKLFRRRKQIQPVMAVAESTGLAPVVVATPSIPRRAGKRPPIVRPQIFAASRVVAARAASAERRTVKLLTVLRARLKILSAYMKRWSKQLLVRSKWLATCIWHWLVPRAKHAWVLLCRLVKAAHLLSVEFWHWLEPHIRSFDRWLERQLHRNRTAADALRAGSDISAHFAAECRKLGRLAKNAYVNARKAWHTTNQ